jgi:ABC-type glycerol-3-phosphate transport system permease component
MLALKSSKPALGGIKPGFAANVVLHLFCLFLVYFPMYFMLISSLKTNPQMLQSYFLPTLPLHFENYAAAFRKVSFYLLNTVSICGVTVVGVAVLSSINSYVFARFQFPGKNLLFTYLLMFMMIPGALTLIPLFTLVAGMKLTNSPLGCILPYISFGQIIFTFVLRSFIEQIPKDLFDSAQIDGASHFTVFIHIVLPLSMNIIISMMLMNFLANWNDFIWPLLVLRKEELRTITVGLYSFTDVQQIQYGPMFAGFVLGSLPIMLLFNFNMRFFITGMTAGAIKA